jgi:hypothetical protein
MFASLKKSILFRMDLVELDFGVFHGANIPNSNGMSKSYFCEGNRLNDNIDSLAPLRPGS